MTSNETIQKKKRGVTEQAALNVSQVTPSPFPARQPTLCGSNPANPQGKQRAFSSCSDPLAKLQRKPIVES